MTYPTSTANILQIERDRRMVAELDAAYMIERSEVKRKHFDGAKAFFEMKWYHGYERPHEVEWKQILQQERTKKYGAIRI